MTIFWDPRNSLRLQCLLVGGLLFAAGCGVADIDGTYGKRRGSPGEQSVNGTRVLAEMFHEAGWKVTTRRFLSPRVNGYRVIVWAPDDFGPPSDDVRSFLEDWLSRGQNKTLVYIGRDYDATIRYWEAVRGSAPPDQIVEVLRRLAKARAAHATRRAGMPADESFPWFTVRRDAGRGSGGGPSKRTRWDGTWLRDQAIQPSRIKAEIAGCLQPPPARTADGRRNPYRSEVLLASPQGVLAYRLTNHAWPNSQIVVAANGSFLLNLPLVEQEHRKLAGKLIADCGPPAKVAFLESGEAGLFVFSDEPGSKFPTGFEALTVWPLGAIVWHFLAVGVLFLFSRMAIFGRPKDLPPEGISDFGRHVHAFGEMLASTGDQRFARAQLAAFQEKTKRDSRAEDRGNSAATGESE